LDGVEEPGEKGGAVWFLLEEAVVLPEFWEMGKPVFSPWRRGAKRCERLMNIHWMV